MDFKLTTPVVFIIFNRPETTIRVFEEIRKAKPQKLLLIADGPRKNKIGEAAKCEEVKKIVENIDWDCVVLKNYSEENLGCKVRISSGLEWVFDNVEEAIVLEDDCLPNQTFFRFCQEMLEKYRFDKRIMHIAGTNVHSLSKNSKDSYYFSGFANIWGWATWRRAFKYYDVGIKDWPEDQRCGFLESVIEDSWYRKYVRDVLSDIHNGYVDTWDYQWTYAVWKNKGICIDPNVNLVSNIGFGDGATHTQKKNAFMEKMTFDLNFPLLHPTKIVRDLEKDKKEIIRNRMDWKYKYLPYGLFKVLKKMRNGMRRLRVTL